MTSIRLVIRAKVTPEEEVPEPAELKAHWRPVPLIIAGVLLLGIVAAGIYFLAPGETPVEAKAPVIAPTAVVDVPRQDVSRPEPPVSAQTPPSPPAVSASAPAAASDPSSPINEVIPVVPRSASETIRGTIRVLVQVSVDGAGNVVAATAEEPGPSRYFERLSLEAARKWTFPPAAGGGTRQIRVKFNYNRSGTTG